MTFDYGTLPGRALADTPSAWDVQLPGDDRLVIYASSYGPGAGVLEYNLLLAGRPPELMPVVAGPAVLLGDVCTEEPEDLPANDFDWHGPLDVEFVEVPRRWSLQLTNQHELLICANDLQERHGEHVFTLRVRGDARPRMIDEPVVFVTRLNGAMDATAPRGGGPCRWCARA